MKKIFFWVIVLCCVSVGMLSSAVALGVSPAQYVVNFQPGYEGDFHFSFNTGDSDAEFEVYKSGALTEYVILKNQGGEVDVNLKLPQHIETPGRHRIEIGAIEKPSGEGTVGIVANVQGVIDVHVPYPGKYAELMFSVEDGNDNQNLPYRLVVYSRGTETITANPQLNIYDLMNRSIKTFDLGTKDIQGGESGDFNVKLDSSQIGAGDYRAVVTVLYDGREVSSQDFFRIGELRVKIVNYTTELEKDKINPFFIDVESVWNDPIPNVYAEVFVTGTDISFLTPSKNINPWETTRLTGYFDTTDVEVGANFPVRMIVNYNGESTEETVYLTFVSSRSYLLFIAIAVGVIAIVLFAIWVIVKLKKLEGKSGKSIKRK